PSGFSDLVFKLLAKDPAERPASARAVIAALETLPLGQTTSSFLPAGALVPSKVRPPDDASGAQRPADISSVPPPAKGRRRLAVPLAAAVLLAVLGFLGYLFGPAVIRIATNQG